MSPLRPWELISGPFVGLEIYGRARRELRPSLSFAWVMLLVFVLGSVLSTLRFVALDQSLEQVSDSALRLIPRLHLEETGRFWMEGPPGRLVDAGAFVLLLDPEAREPAFPPRLPGDLRPRVAALETGLWVLKHDNPVPSVKPWPEVVASEGPMSLDGPELLHWMKDFVPKVVLWGWVVVTAFVLLYHLILQGFFVFLHQVFARRKDEAMGVGEVFVISSVASFPALFAGALTGGLGVPHSTVLAVHLLLLGGLFFVAATAERWRDEQQSGANLRPGDEEASPPP